MYWMGQSTIESISRYLKPARKDEVLHIVNRSFTGMTSANRRSLGSQTQAVA
jgi:hypothetical protein